MDEDAVLKTAAPHGVVGSIPTLSAPLVFQQLPQAMVTSSRK